MAPHKIHGSLRPGNDLDLVSKGFLNVQIDDLKSIQYLFWICFFFFFFFLFFYFFKMCFIHTPSLVPPVENIEPDRPGPHRCIPHHWSGRPSRPTAGCRIYGIFQRNQKKTYSANQNVHRIFGPQKYKKPKGDVCCLDFMKIFGLPTFAAGVSNSNAWSGELVTFPIYFHCFQQTTIPMQKNQMVELISQPKNHVVTRWLPTKAHLGALLQQIRELRIGRQTGNSRAPNIKCLEIGQTKPNINFLFEICNFVDSCHIKPPLFGPPGVPPQNLPKRIGSAVPFLGANENETWDFQV